MIAAIDRGEIERRKRAMLDARAAMTPESKQFQKYLQGLDRVRG